jgi:hypothetical protein
MINVEFWWSITAEEAIMGSAVCDGAWEIFCVKSIASFLMNEICALRVLLTYRFYGGHQNICAD